MGGLCARSTGVERRPTRGILVPEVGERYEHSARDQHGRAEFADFNRSITREKWPRMMTAGSVAFSPFPV